MMAGMKKHLLLTLFCEQGLSPVGGDEDSDTVNFFLEDFVGSEQALHCCFSGDKIRFVGEKAISSHLSHRTWKPIRCSPCPWRGLDICTEAFSVVPL